MFEGVREAIVVVFDNKKNLCRVGFNRVLKKYIFAGSRKKFLTYTVVLCQETNLALILEQKLDDGFNWRNAAFWLVEKEMEKLIKKE